jgi:hypothetical protein
LGLRRRLAKWLLRELLDEGFQVGKDPLALRPTYVQFPPLTADPALAEGMIWLRGDLDRLRYSGDGSTVISLDPSLTAADVWGYSTRTLTQAKFPFWSAIITQTQETASVAGGATVNVDIQPPSGETWYVSIDFGLTLESSAYAKRIIYQDYDGTTVREHRRRYFYATGTTAPAITTADSMVVKILTNTLYARLTAYSAYATTFEYGYSGFKLSKPLWSPERFSDPKPWKRTKTKSLPKAIEALDKYAFDILGINPNLPDDYDLAIILEEDTPLAFDPVTKFPVERFTAVVQADVLADFIAKFKAGTADPVATGYRKYLDRWKKEGIDFGV